MQGYQIRRAAVVLLGILLVIFAVTQTARFFARVASNEATQTSQVIDQLSDAETANSQVRLTYSGPIVAKEDYYQIRMTISTSQRSLEVINGYGQVVGKRRVLGNDQPAYATFLRTLKLNDFNNDRTSSLGGDERGVCFKGKRIVGEILISGESTSRLWAASCSRKLGTMDARWQDILKLFQDQFPDYDQQTKAYRF